MMRRVARLTQFAQLHRYKASIQGFKGAQKMFQKVEEGALARAAARQSSSALGRMEVANRKADHLLR
jgi:hypothetical protein